MFGKGPNVCPRCGERVSAFAAGCAICDAELDPNRGDHPALSVRMKSWTRGVRLSRRRYTAPPR